MDIFQQASRLKLRFETSRGLLSVEDLWDLPLTSKTGKTNLDDIGRPLLRQIVGSGEAPSLVDPQEKVSTMLQLSFDVVKAVIDVKVTERNTAAVAAANKEKKQKLLQILEGKENEALGNLSMEELRTQINAL